MATTLRLLREAAQAALDDLGVYAASTGAATTVTLPALINATANASANTYDGAWVYVASGLAGTAGQQRRVRPGGYDPATGALTIFPNWTTAPVGGEMVELTRTFPSTSPPSSVVPTVAGTSGEDVSYRTLLNRALALLAKPAELTLAITTARTYSLAAYPWLDRPERLLGIREPDAAGGAPIDAGWRGFRLRLNAELPLLQVDAPFLTASGNLTLDVLRPCLTWIATNGVWAASTVGLVDESDSSTSTADVDAEDVMAAFLMLAYEALAARSPGRPYPNARELAVYWRERAIASRWWDRTREAARPAPVPAGEAA